MTYQPQGNCGFYNFNALKGCSKCLKEFPTTQFGSKPDYYWELWPKRDSTKHIELAIKSCHASTASERCSLERSYGCKYSSLYDLPVFDVVKFHVVDQMHNLFLGLAKHTTKQWKEFGVLTSHMIPTYSRKSR